MTQFKVGDWVRNKHVTHLISKVQTINKFGEIILENGYLHEITDDSLELWQPKEGEWCWFGQRLGKVLDVSTVQGKVKVKSTVEYPVYVMNGRKKELYETRDDWNIDNVEPFIGQLPRFLKDK